MAERKRRTHRAPRVTGPDGRKVSLHDLPLVAFYLSCGHIQREYGVAKGDLIFCKLCSADKRVTKVIA